MKQTLLSLVFILCGLFAFSQDQLANNFPSENTAQSIKVYPNPVTSVLQITDNDLVKEVRIYNMIGRQIKNFDTNYNKQFYVADLPNGMYLVQLVGDRNKIIRTQRVNKR